MKLTISEALGWLKTLTQRHQELVNLRNQNSVTSVTRYGVDDKREIKPEYNSKKLDKRITLIARETRILNDKIKRMNATVVVEDYLRDENVLGELED